MHGTKYCDDCRELQAWADRRRRKGRQVLKRKPCRGCGKPKGPGKRNYCDRCQAARAFYPCIICHTEPVRGPRKRMCVECHRTAPERKRAAAAAYREKVMADPELRARQRESERRSHEKAKRLGKYKRSHRNRVVKLPRLPAPPLAEVVEQTRVRLEREGVEAPLNRIAEQCEVAPRSFLRWTEDPSRTVQFETALRVLDGLDLHWWDVWDQAEYPDVVRAMETAR